MERIKDNPWRIAVAALIGATIVAGGVMTERGFVTDREHDAVLEQALQDGTYGSARRAGREKELEAAIWEGTYDKRNY